VDTPIPISYGYWIIDSLLMGATHVLLLLVVGHVRIAGQAFSYVGDLLCGRESLSSVDASSHMDFNLATVSVAEFTSLAIG
jgi:hypothetical protein